MAKCFRKSLFLLYRVPLFSILVFSFLSTNLFAERKECKQKVIEVTQSPTLWDGVSAEQIQQRLLSLRMIDSIGPVNRWIIVSDEGVNAGAKTTPKGILAMRSQSMGVAVTSIASTKNQKTSLYMITGSPSALANLLGNIPIQIEIGKAGLRYVDKADPFKGNYLHPLESDKQNDVPSTRSQAEDIARSSRAVSALFNKLSDAGIAEINVRLMQNIPFQRRQLPLTKYKIKQALKEAWSPKKKPQYFKTFEGFNQVLAEVKEKYKGWSFRKMWKDSVDIDIANELKALNDAGLIKYIALRRANPEKLDPEWSIYVFELILQLPHQPDGMDPVVQVSLKFNWGD